VPSGTSETKKEGGEEMKKVYVVFWSDSFDDWRMEKVFESEEKARAYIGEKKRNLWFVEQEVE
jgi:hypothetical protein